MRTDDAIEEDTPVFIWTSDRFLSLRKEFLENKSAVTAVDILKRLVSIELEEVEPAAWLDAKDLICLLLGNIPVADLLGVHQILILSTVNSTSTAVIYTLAKFLTSKPEATELLKTSALAVSIAFARRINDSECAEVIAHLLGPIATQPEILQDLRHQLEGNKDSEHRFRIYEVVLAACQVNAYSPSLSPLLEGAVGELSGDDVLTQLTALEMLSSVAVCGRLMVQTLNSMGVPQRIHGMMRASKESPDGGFLYPGCLKFFGYLCKVEPEGLTAFPDFITSVFDLVRHFDLLDASQRILAFDTLGFVGYSAEAKDKIMEVQGHDAFHRAMSSFGAAIGSGPAEMRARHMEALKMLFENGSETVNSQLFDWLGEPFPKLLFDTMQKPFPELRLSALSLSTQLCSYEFGKRALLSIGGFVEWLTNNDTEHEWEGVQQKSKLVRLLIDSNSPLIDAPLLIKLKGYFITRRADVHVDSVNL